MPKCNDVVVELRRVLATMDLPELKKFCAGTLQAATEGQREMRARFPLEYVEWEMNAGEGRVDDGSSDR